MTFLLGSALRKLAAGPGAGVLLYMPYTSSASLHSCRRRKIALKAKSKVCVALLSFWRTGG